MESTKMKVLLIDDDIVQHAHIGSILDSFESPKCDLTCEADPTKALDCIRKTQFDFIITDFVMPGISGTDVFRQIKAFNPSIPIAFLTAHESIDLAIKTLQAGAYDFFVKPVKPDILLRTLVKLRDHNLLQREVERLKHIVHEDFSIASIIGTSKPIQEVVETIGRCAHHNVNVLIRGESGTGKELAARAIHHASPRSGKPFVIVNIAALSESLIESELFGHVRGAFTGADQDRIGLLEEADGGTLFIDEAGDISPSVQSKLLRAIQFREFQRVGENKTRESDVRIIAATSQDLEKMMEEGVFRRDLFFRLNVVSIVMPPLRERKTDIPELINHFTQKAYEERGLPRIEFSKEAMYKILSYDYPGNIRELQNMTEHAMVFCRESFVTVRDLPDNFQSVESSKTHLISWELGYEGAMFEFERKLLREALEETHGNQSKAARLLGIGERRLRYRLEKIEVSPSPTKPLE